MKISNGTPTLGSFVTFIHKDVLAFGRVCGVSSDCVLVEAVAGDLGLWFRLPGPIKLFNPNTVALVPVPPKPITELLLQ